MAGGSASTTHAYTPAEIAHKAELAGVDKANVSFPAMATLATLAGAFVALGAAAFQAATAGWTGSYGAQQALGGLIFNMGLLLCSVAGAELFTGNSLLIMPALTRKISVGKMLRNWGIVYTFNMLGSVLVAFLLYRAHHWAGGDNAVGVRALAIAAGKVSYSSEVIFFRGILCNMLVCLAVWMGYAGRSVTDKVMAYLLPIAGFVAAGYEHSVANMFYIPYAMMLKGQAELTALPGVPMAKLGYLTMAGFGRNLLWATLGNLVGGVLMVGVAYWYVYLKKSRSAELHQAGAQRAFGD